MRYLSVLVFAVCLVPSVGGAQSEATRVYVRRIEFQGAENVSDNVLRRELLQLEGAYLNTVALEQSRLRLERLPYIESAQTIARAVAGTRDQVDILIIVTMAPARRYGGGGAYSEAQRASVHGYFVNDNIFGTGQHFSAAMDVSDFRRDAELSHTNPYTHSEHIGRTISLSSRRVDQLTADTTELEAELTSARLDYRYRTGEREALTLGIALHDVDLASGSMVSEQLRDWLQRNGNPTIGENDVSTRFRTAEFLLRWQKDAGNGQAFPDRGLEHSVTLRSAVPGSDVEYYAIDYQLTKYWPLARQWTARFDTNLGFGAQYGSSTSSLPPYLNWFAGGPGSVRGYRESRLGPRDSLGNPYGGNLFVSGQFEFLMPLPEKWRERTRIGFFYDVGNVFSTEKEMFLDDVGQPLDYGFELSRLRQSVGISARVLIPIGVLQISYGIPLNAEDENPNKFLRDDVERFQLTIGVDF